MEERLEFRYATAARRPPPTWGMPHEEFLWRLEDWSLAERLVLTGMPLDHYSSHSFEKPEYIVCENRYFSTLIAAAAKPKLDRICDQSLKPLGRPLC